MEYSSEVEEVEEIKVKKTNNKGAREESSQPVMSQRIIFGTI